MSKIVTGTPPISAKNFKKFKEKTNQIPKEEKEKALRKAELTFKNLEFIKTN